VRARKMKWFISSVALLRLDFSILHRRLRLHQPRKTTVFALPQHRVDLAECTSKPDKSGRSFKPEISARGTFKLMEVAVLSLASFTAAGQTAELERGYGDICIESE
jgi:hypothetical protein